MKVINTALGLPADAAQETTVAAITQLKNRLAQVETQSQSLEKQNRDLLLTQVERDLDSYANRFHAEAKEKWKAALLSNRAATLELLQSLPLPTAPAATPPAETAPPVLHNRQAAKTPASTLPGGANVSAAQVRAVREYQGQHHCDWQNAWSAVRSERPELFPNP